MIRVSPRDDYTLELWFSTGDHRLFDMTPYLERGVFTQVEGSGALQARLGRL
ncbi:MAG: DUF2442 domain-containing protein [Methylococcus sp.]